MKKRTTGLFLYAVALVPIGYSFLIVWGSVMIFGISPLGAWPTLAAMTILAVALILGGIFLRKTH